jgi:hypothetical protein
MDRVIIGCLVGSAIFAALLIGELGGHCHGKRSSSGSGGWGSMRAWPTFHIAGTASRLR